MKVCKKTLFTLPPPPCSLARTTLTPLEQTQAGPFLVGLAGCASLNDQVEVDVLVSWIDPGEVLVDDPGL